jgi:flagellar protein FliS
MTTQNPYQKKNGTNPYLQQKIMSASPTQLIAYVYDAGVAACRRQDKNKALRAVSILVQSLNFDYRETARTFSNVYSHLRRLISKGNFQQAESIFADLKSTWAEAFKVV